ncbi:MAG TPA: hypothetical protein VJU61_03255, partial [Polyangiaceae bacterium]|nr:hypothetical protein [Polyangiaceae bacterium]
PSLADGSNLRCFDQKRRFGVDFLYPTERYVNALSQPQLCPSNPTLATEDCPGGSVANPLFAGGRLPQSVYLAGIVGVPWQSISANQAEDGSALPEDVLRFKTAAEFERADWDRILGAPSASPPRPPGEPLMRESTVPRDGVVTGGPNGREYATDASLPGLAEDLQYACIFPLPQPRECKDETPQSCDCTPTLNDQPLCEAEPGVSEPTTVQRWAKAYPGLRELEVLQGYGDNSIVASICARNVRDLDRRDFGYRPAIASIVDRLEEQLARRCLPRPLEVKADGSVPCKLVEVQPNAETCSCDASIARVTPTRLVEQSVRQQLASGEGRPCGADDPACQRACLCEIQQITTEPALSACQNEDNPSSAEGWCYVADSEDQHIGKPAFVDECRSTERRVLRFVGEGIRKGALAVISCSGRSFAQEE